MKKIPSVSVIIPTLNEERYLPILLKSLSKINSPLEIIVVDGGSTDGTAKAVERAKQLFSGDTRLQFISVQKKGIGLQRNIGVTYATNEILLFCDADIIAPSALEHEYIVSEFFKNEYAVATSKIVPLEKTIRSILLHRVAYAVQKILAQARRYYFGGAYMLTTKKVFNGIGGFDESLRISEDVDYSKRASKKGKSKIFSVPIKVSTRRYQKYGYLWIFKHPLIMAQLLTQGKITNKDTHFYPFGEY